MKRTRVKICGITRPEDALVCAKAGADAIGLMFYVKSPRFITPEVAAEIVAGLPPFVSTVGLFVNADETYVRDVLARVPLDCLQFHGDETPEFCEQFARPFIKAIRFQPDTDLFSQIKHYRKARALLLDTYDKNAYGGTGKTFDWKLIPKQDDMTIILAGGLNPQNVVKAIETVHPYAVDVSGGVEKVKGIKDPELIEQFINEVQCVGTTE